MYLTRVGTLEVFTIQVNFYLLNYLHRLVDHFKFITLLNSPKSCELFSAIQQKSLYLGRLSELPVIILSVFMALPTLD